VVAAAGAAWEALEARQLMSSGPIHLDQNTGLLTVTGDSQVVDNQIQIGRQGNWLDVSVNGSAKLFPFSDVNEVLVKPSLSSATAELTVDFSGGSPVPAGGFFYSPTDGAGAELAVIGTDQADVIDISGTKPDSSMVDINCDVVHYQSVGQIDVFGGADDDTLRVNSLPLDGMGVNLYGQADNDSFDIEQNRLGKFRVEGGDGNDNLEVAASTKQISIFTGFYQGNVIFDGGAGTDAVTLHNEDSGAGCTIDSTPSGGVVTDNELTLEHTTIESLNINGGSINEVEVHGTAAGTATTFNGGDNGINQVLVDIDGAAGPLASVKGVQSLFTFNCATSGINELTLDNSGVNADTCVTVNSSSIGLGAGDNFFAPGGGLAYKGLSEITINLGGGYDTTIIQSTEHWDTLHLNTGRGDDLVFIGDVIAGFGYTTEHVDSDLFVDGQEGANTVTTDDSGVPWKRRLSMGGDAKGGVLSGAGSFNGDNYFGTWGTLLFHNITALNVKCGSGGNDVTIDSAPPETTVNVQTGMGNDFIHIGSWMCWDVVHGIVSKIMVDGQRGQDRLDVDDEGDTNSALMTVTASQIGLPGDNVFGAGGTLFYSGLEYLLLHAGTGGAYTNVRGTCPGTATLVLGNTGPDEVIIDSNGTLPGGTVDGVQSILGFDGGAGYNYLSAQDSSDLTGDQITVTPTAVGQASGDSYFGLGGSLGFGNVAKLIVSGGSGNDQVIVQGTNPSTQVAIGGGDGSDIFLVDANGTAAGGTVAGVCDVLTLSGGAGNNMLIVNDEGNSLPDRVTVTNSSIGSASTDSFFGPGGRLGYSQVGFVTLNTGTNDDVVNVQSVGFGVALGANLGAGNDLLQVDSNGPGPGGTVDNVLGVITVNGGVSGSDRLLLEDSSDVTGDVLSILPTAATAGSIGKKIGDTFFGPGGALNYANVVSASLNLGNGGNVINAVPSPTLAGTKFSVNAPLVAQPLDVLNIMVAGVTGPVLNGTAASGFLTSLDHSTINWSRLKAVNLV
jgi:hypothetical protein